jgi:hypothetical protein
MVGPDLARGAARRDRVAGLDERQIRWLLAGMGFGSFVLLLALEIVTEADEISLLDLVVDALGLLLTISAAVGVALLAQRVQAQHEEKAALVRDLELAGPRARAGAPRCSRA